MTTVPLPQHIHLKVNFSSIKNSKLESHAEYSDMRKNYIKEFLKTLKKVTVANIGTNWKMPTG